MGARGQATDRRAFDVWLGREDASSARPAFGRAIYLGGLPSRPKASVYRSTLFATDEGIAFGSQGLPFGSDRAIVVRWTECTGITVDGDQEAKRKVGAVVAFGVLGGLAAKEARDRTFLTVHRSDGAAAYFEVSDVSPYAARARLTPFLSTVGVELS